MNDFSYLGSDSTVTETPFTPEQMALLQNMITATSKTADGDRIANLTAQIKELNDRIADLLAENKALKAQLTGDTSAVDAFKKIDFREKFLNTLKLKDKSTQDGYRATLNSFGYFLDGEDYTRVTGEDYLRVTPEDVIEYLQELLQRNKASTVNNRHEKLRKFYDFIMKEQDKAEIKRILKVNPFTEVEQKKVKDIPKPPMSTKQFYDFVTLSKKLPNESIYGFIAEILVGTGMRINELLALKKSDIDLKNRIISIRESKTDVPRKTSYPVILRSKMSLYCTRLQADDLLFNQSYGTVRRHFEHISDMCEIKVIGDDGTVYGGSPHTLRHTFASTLEEKGVPISLLNRVMGHVPGTETERTYIKNDYVEKFKPLNDQYTILNGLPHGV